MERGARQAAVHRFAKSRTRLTNLHFHFQYKHTHTHYVKWKKWDTSGHIMYDHLYHMARISKSTGTENRKVVARGWLGHGSRGIESKCLKGTGPLAKMKCSGGICCECPKTFGSHSLKGDFRLYTLHLNLKVAMVLLPTNATNTILEMWNYYMQWKDPHVGYPAHTRHLISIISSSPHLIALA